MKPGYIQYDAACERKFDKYKNQLTHSEKQR